MQVGYAMTTFHRETEQPVIGFDMGGNERIKHYHVIWSWIGLIFLLEIVTAKMMVKVALRMCLYFQFNYIAPNVWKKSAVPNYIDWDDSVRIFLVMQCLL